MFMNKCNRSSLIILFTVNLSLRSRWILQIWLYLHLSQVFTSLSFISETNYFKISTLNLSGIALKPVCTSNKLRNFLIYGNLQNRAILAFCFYLSKPCLNEKCRFRRSVSCTSDIRWKYKNYHANVSVAHIYQSF